MHPHILAHARWVHRECSHLPYQPALNDMLAGWPATPTARPIRARYTSTCNHIHSTAARAYGTAHRARPPPLHAAGGTPPLPRALSRNPSSPRSLRPPHPALPPPGQLPPQPLPSARPHDARWAPPPHALPPPARAPSHALLPQEAAQRWVEQVRGPGATVLHALQRQGLLLHLRATHVCPCACTCVCIPSLQPAP